MALESRELNGNHQETYDKLVESALLESPEVLKALEQVETKPGLAWEEPKAEAPLGREPKPQSPVEEEPLIQVETNIPVGEATELPVLTDEVVPEIIPIGEATELPTLTDEIEDPNFSKIEEIKGRENNPFVGVTIEQGEEKTPKEWRDRLRGLIDSAKEKLNMGERGEQLKGFIARRLEELDLEGEKTGKFEEVFRSMGEKYNKLGWKSKLAVGASLGVGAATFTSVSMPAVFACISGIVVQRVYGMAGTFLKAEKYLQENKELNLGFRTLKLKEGKGNLKGAALTGAALYSIGFGALIGKTIEFASETEIAHTVQRWLGDILGHHTSAPEVSPSSHLSTGKVTETFAASQPAAAAAAGEVVSTPTPEISVAHTPDIPSSVFEGQNPDIDDETRKRAMEFVTAHNPQEAVIADVSVVDETPLPVPVESVDTIPTPIEHTVPVPTEHTVSAPIENTVSIPVEHTIPTPIEHTVPVPETEHLVDSSGAPVVDSEGSPIHTGAGEALSSINRFGIPVSSADPHLYLDVDKNIVFHGGSPEEKIRLITEYLTQHKGTVIYASDAEGHRVPWFQDIADKIQQGPPTRSKNFFGFGTFKFDTPPNPNDFKEILH